MTDTRHSYAPACRSENPGDCAQCTLAYDCRNKIENGLTVHWPIVGLAIFGVLAVLAQVV